MREGDISTYHDALMRCLLFPHREGAKGVGSERFRAGEIVSHAIGEGELCFGISSGNRFRNGAGWSVTKASKGGEYAMV